MAFDVYLAERIEHYLRSKGYDFVAKKMMGGLCFMLNDKMICGPMFLKKAEAHVLMVRIGEEKEKQLGAYDGVLPMDFTGRPMKGYLFVKMNVLDSDDQLEFWLDLCLDFNRTLK